MRTFALCLALLCAMFANLAMPLESAAAELGYPQVIRTRYEAADPKGGNFIIWLDRDRLHHGLDPRLYPAARYVEVTHVTPSPGSPTVSMIEVMSVNSTTPEFYHVAGIVRFKVTGMVVKSTNVPDR
jgi:hypothetical protein